MSRFAGLKPECWESLVKTEVKVCGGGGVSKSGACLAGERQMELPILEDWFGAEAASRRLAAGSRQWLTAGRVNR